MNDPFFDWTGKVVLVTGGSRGLGHEIVMAFAERGADVIVASRKLDKCEAVAEEVRRRGRRALAVAANVGRWEDCDRLIERSYAEFGRVDILVNNAGSGPSAPSHEVTEELFDKVIALNFKGPFRLAAKIAHAMQRGDGGSIINISSIGSMFPMPQAIPYGSAKAALNAMTVSLAREYAPKVRVNTIAPGAFLTDIAKSWTDEMRGNPLSFQQRSGNPQEIITAVLYFASPMSSYTTGALLRVDGGF